MTEQKPTITFNQHVLREVEQTIEQLKSDRLNEAFTRLTWLHRDLVTQVRRDKRLETESLK